MNVLAERRSLPLLQRLRFARMHGQEAGVLFRRAVQLPVQLKPWNFPEVPPLALRPHVELRLTFRNTVTEGRRGRFPFKKLFRPPRVRRVFLMADGSWGFSVF